MESNDNILDTSENNVEKETSKRPSAFLILISILLSGTSGWKQLRRSRLKPEETAAGCFYPLAAAAAVCRFADWFYAPEFSLTSTLTGAVSVFVAFFFSYFAVLIFSKWLLPADISDRIESPYYRQMVQYALSSLALFWIPSEIFPLIEPITVFLPLWTVFVITKGIRFLRIPHERDARAIATIVPLTVAMPYLVMWLCEKIF